MFHLKCQSQKYILHREWTFGLQDIECDSIDKIQFFLSTTEDRVESFTIGEFKDFFVFIFKFLLKTETQRVIDVTTLSKILICIMGNDKSPFTDSFCKFIQENVKTLNIDQWKMFVEFSNNIKKDFSNYDSNDAWPLLYDNYVDWVKRNYEMDIILE